MNIERFNPFCYQKSNNTLLLLKYRVLQCVCPDGFTRISASIGWNTQLPAFLLRQIQVSASVPNHAGHYIRIPRCFTMLSQNDIFKIQPNSFVMTFHTFSFYTPHIYAHVCIKNTEL